MKVRPRKDLVGSIKASARYNFEDLGNVKLAIEESTGMIAWKDGANEDG